jgi:ubiquitin-like-conjugating enzyme ATG10
MSRDVTLLESPIDLDDSDELQDSTVTEADDVAVAVSSDPALSCAQYVVYSATFQVPAFYFTVSRPGALGCD